MSICIHSYLFFVHMQYAAWVKRDDKVQEKARAGKKRGRRKAAKAAKRAKQESEPSDGDGSSSDSESEDQSTVTPPVKKADKASKNRDGASFRREQQALSGLRKLIEVLGRATDDQVRAVGLFFWYSHVFCVGPVCCYRPVQWD
jgi:hypothetical protein